MKATIKGEEGPEIQEIFWSGLVMGKRWDLLFALIIDNTLFVSSLNKKTLYYLINGN